MTTKNPYGLTRANRSNLDKLATYLEGLPRGYKHFDMESYIADRPAYDDTVVKYLLKNGGLYNNCGTSGCALGHGPAAGILARRGIEIVPRRWTSGEQVDWDAYGHRFVDEETDEYRRILDFLFSGQWGALRFYDENGDDLHYEVKVDDHHYGAAARIRFILDGNLVPEFFNDDDRASMVRTKKLYKEYSK